MASFQWNVYIAQVGFVESDVTKLHPVLVLCEPVESHKIVLVAPIFSAKAAHNLVGDIKIIDNHTEIGLIKPSTIRLHRLVSLPASDLKERIGQTSPIMQNAIKTGLKNLFNL